MTDPMTGATVWLATVLVAALSLSLTAVLSAAREPDWWMILRGIAVGERARLARFVRLVRGVRRG